MAEDKKVGEGHLAAMGRLGVRELRGATYPGSNVAQQSEYGLYGTLTPGEVAESRRGDGRDLDEESPRGNSILADRLQQAKDRSDRDLESKDRDLDRG